MSQHVVVLLLGTNLGDKKKNIEDAVEWIEKSIGKIDFQSKILETIPIDFVSYNNFFNFAIELRTVLTPMEVLIQVKDIEQKLGRMKDSKALGGYQDRLIDIDIVQYDHLEFNSKKLKIPHQAHLKREFSIELLEDLNKIKHKV